MRTGFSPSSRYIAARDFSRNGELVKAGTSVEGTRATLRRFYRQRKIDKAPAKLPRKVKGNSNAD